MFSPIDGPFLEMVAQWIEDGDTPSLLPATHGRLMRMIAKGVTPSEPSRLTPEQHATMLDAARILRLRIDAARSDLSQEALDSVRPNE